MTGFYEFYPNEAGYDELRRFFDYTREVGLVGTKLAGQENGDAGGAAVNGGAKVPETCVIDADDLLDDPAGILRTYCKSIDLDFTTDMLNWNNEEDQERAKTAFEKWKGFHEDAIDSTDLKPRTHVRCISWTPSGEIELTMDRRKQPSLKLNGTRNGRKSMAKMLQR